MLISLFCITFCQANVRVSLNESWMFSRSDSMGNYDQWQKVDIPHTWNAEDTDDETPGYFRDKCMYKKSVVISASKSKERVFLYFEGANQETTLWVNGRQVGNHRGGYAGFGFDITEYVKFGQSNQLEIVVTNAYDKTIAPLSADFTFYGGIYRDVWLSYLPQVHFSTRYYGSSGIVVTTPHKDGNFKQVDVLCRLQNHEKKAKMVTVKSTLVDAEGKAVASVSKKMKMAVGEADQVCRLSIPVTKPHLWSDVDPYLYKVNTEVVDNATRQVCDENQATVGFRWYSFDPQKGFFLNGKHVKLIGTSRHQDFLKKGNALSDNIHMADVYKLKDMGGNFLRVAHYPQDPTILEVCDRLGILTSVEIPVVNAVDGSDEFLENCKYMQMEMIYQNRNHPSVVMWGWMNEILLRIPAQYDKDRATYYPMVRRVATELDQLSRREDPERYTMMAVHNAFERYQEAGLVNIPQIFALNLYQGWYEPDIHEFEQILDKVHAALPNQSLMVTEYGAGIDPRLHSFQSERFDFSEEYGLKYHVHYLREMKKRDFVAGSSVWNLADFYSEVRGDAVPHVNSKGILGLDRSEKDAYLYYKAMLAEKPVLYIGGKNWKYRSCVSATAEGRMDVPVFAKAEKVSVYCNQKLVGTFDTVDGVAMVSVPFVDGENRVEAFAEINGQKVTDAIVVDMRIIPVSFAKGFPIKGLHVTCGSLRYMEDKEESLCWMPEKAYEPGSWGYVGGTVYRRSGNLLGTDADILGTDKDPIYQTQRQDIEAFKADVPDGEYIITLHFASLKEAAALVYNLSAKGDAKEVDAASTFDVVVNGQKVLEEFDPSSCGMSRAIAKRIHVQVKNGHGLDVRFMPIKGKTILNAIEIYKR